MPGAKIILSDDGGDLRNGVGWGIEQGILLTTLIQCL